MTLDEAIKHVEKTNNWLDESDSGAIHICHTKYEAIMQCVEAAKRYNKIRAYLKHWSIIPGRWMLGMRDKLIECSGDQTVDSLVDQL